MRTARTFAYVRRYMSYRIFEMNYFHLQVVHMCRTFSPVTFSNVYHTAQRNGIDRMIVALKKNLHLLTTRSIQCIRY